jgi:acyl-CoA synthetase (AMP-forming)/AMP-acid ligase II
VEHREGSLSIPYKTLLDEALAIGGALQARGLAPGERVALVTPDVAEFIRGFFGISVAGLVPVPLFPPAQAGDIPTFTRQSRQILVASRASAVVTSPEVAALLLDASETVLTVAALRDGPALAAPMAPAPSAIALLQFTSGSTAAPKGVVLTHANIDANVRAIAGPDGLSVTAEDVGVSWLPLYHDMGLIGTLLAGMYAQVDLVMMSPVLFLKRPTAWLDAISTYRGTISFAPNFAYELCVRRVKPSQVDSFDLSSWRIAGCGAEPIRHEALRGFAEHFARARFRASSLVPSYGLAEHTLAVSFSRGRLTIDSVDPGRLGRESRAVPVTNGSPAVRIVGCGRPFPGHAVRVIDEEGRPLPERHVGQIVAQGPSVMAGYFDDPQATAEALHDGWLHTGDLGYVADGELFVCGRIKDLIIRHGRKYHPPDLESTIADVEGIRASGVVVFAVNRLAETHQVVAVLEARPSAAPADIIDSVRRRVRDTAGLELDEVVVAPPGTIPRTTSGKVRRAETRARFEAGTLLSSDRGL